MNDERLYQVNVGLGLVLTGSLIALLVLMVLLWPRTRLTRLAAWFVFGMVAVMVRWSAAAVRPDLFSARESLVPTVIFAGATICTLVFAVVAWVEYVRDARNGS